MTPPPVQDESTIGGWIGAAYAIVALLGWIPIDMLLHHYGKEYITTEVRELLAGGGWEAIAFVAIVGAVIGVALFHFFWQRG